MPIPDVLANAFERAADLYFVHWAPGVEEPTVATFGGRNYTISRLCDLIETAGYSDEIPTPMLERLSKIFHLHPHGDLNAKFKDDLSYANAAHCLRELIQRRKMSAR